MELLGFPRLRPLQAVRFVRDEVPCVRFVDPAGLVNPAVMVPEDMYQHVVRHFDGTRGLAEIQARVLRETGQLLREEKLRELIDFLEREMVLDGPTYREAITDYRAQRLRRAALAGRSYPASERALRAQLGRFFADSQGAGLLNSGEPGRDQKIAPGPAIRGVMSPHIDFPRGGATYTWAYRAILEQSDADVFVVLGVAHQPCRQRFVLTYKDFQTPLGTVKTERTFVDELAKRVGNHLFDDEVVHRLEHSIEFQVIFLQYVLGDRRDYSIVPILVGSFHDLLLRGIDPIEHPDVKQFTDALQSAEAATRKRALYIGGVDLGHIGAEFGDPGLLNDSTLRQLQAFDSAMLDHAVSGDPAGWFAKAASVGNRWRVCGLAAMYTMLHAMGPTRGKLLRYDQATNPARTCCVSFASMSFEKLEDRPETVS